MNEVKIIFEIPLEGIRSERYDKNVDAAGGEDTNTCFVCGKRIKPGRETMVQYLTNGNIINTDREVEGSQGFFPVGRDCIKKIAIKMSRLTEEA